MYNSQSWFHDDFNYQRLLLLALASSYKLAPGQWGWGLVIISN